MEMDIKEHTMTANSAYLDLLDLHLSESLSDIRGMPTQRTRNGRIYWYDRYRVGSDTKERFLGEDSPELNAKLKSHKAHKDDAKARKERMSSLARIMTADRFMRLDKTSGSLLSAMAKAGFFRLGGVIIGTYAFRAYEGELGIRLSVEQGAYTQDIDIAGFEHLSVAISETDQASPRADDIFKDLKFEAIPAMPNEHIWKWTQTKGEAVVEFLAPSFGSEESTKYLPALGVSAKCLNHLNYLLRDPIDAVLNYGSGVLVKVPSPQRYAIHKLIVSERRAEGPSPIKARKDRMQAELLISVLAQERPDALWDAYQEALSEGPKWVARLESALQKMPKVSGVLNGLTGAEV